MKEGVLVTQAEYGKGEAVFSADSRFDVQPAPADEESLAAAVLERQVRAVIVGITAYRRRLYEALGRPEGAIIARFGVGHENVDKELARANLIAVTNTPGVLDQSAAEHTMWLLGALARHMPLGDAEVRAGRFYAPTGTEVAGKTMGLVGFGAIGRRVAAIAHFGFGLRVVACGRRPAEEIEEAEGQPMSALLEEYGVSLYTTDVEDVIQQADFVSLHLPANNTTWHFIDAKRLSAMRPGALLINTSRGSVVDEHALYDALTSGTLGGAALDVFGQEPYRSASTGADLRELKNVVLTPHIGSNTQEANARMAAACLENIAKFFAGDLDGLSRVD